MSNSKKIIEVVKINIAANPHPEGIYLDLFKNAANKTIRYAPNNEKAAKLSIPKEVEGHNDFYYGYLLTYTVVDKDKTWIDTETDNILSEKEKLEKILIPPNIGTNACHFAYVLDTVKHTLYLEKRNSSGCIIVSHIRKIISILMGPLIQDNDNLPQIEITIIPKKGIVDRILAVPNLKNLIIHIVSPNADATSDKSWRRVMENLNALNATSLDYSLTNNRKKGGGYQT